jgi:hypothetical protein
MQSQVANFRPLTVALRVMAPVKPCKQYGESGAEAYMPLRDSSHIWQVSCKPSSDGGTVESGRQELLFEHLV